MRAELYDAAQRRIYAASHTSPRLFDVILFAYRHGSIFFAIMPHHFLLAAAYLMLSEMPVFRMIILLCYRRRFAPCFFFFFSPRFYYAIVC